MNESRCTLSMNIKKKKTTTTTREINIVGIFSTPAIVWAFSLSRSLSLHECLCFLPHSLSLSPTIFKSKHPMGMHSLNKMTRSHAKPSTLAKWMRIHTTSCDPIENKPKKNNYIFGKWCDRWCDPCIYTSRYIIKCVWSLLTLLAFSAPVKFYSVMHAKWNALLR